MNKQTQFHIGYWLAAVLGILMLQYVYAVNQPIEAVHYSQFQQLLRDGKVEKVAVSNRFIQGTLKEPLPSGKKQFVTTRVDPDLAADLQKAGVTYSGQVESTFFMDLLSWVIPALVFFALWTFLVRRMAGGGLGGGADVDRQEQGQGLRGVRHWGALRRRRRRGRGEGGAAGDR